MILKKLKNIIPKIYKPSNEKVSDIFKEILEIKSKPRLSLEDKKRIQKLQQKLEEVAEFKLVTK